eukprot:4716730-Pyramimonas_sp.AAC.1
MVERAHEIKAILPSKANLWSKRLLMPSLDSGCSAPPARRGGNHWRRGNEGRRGGGGMCQD